MAPQKILAAALALVVAVVLTLTAIALSLPRLGLVVVPAPGGIEVAAVAADSPNRGHIAAGSRLAALPGRGGEIPLDGELLIEEPDQLPDYVAYNRLMERQSALTAALQQDSAAFRTADGARVELSAAPRRLADLPFAYWLQVAVGAAGFLLAAGVWAFRRRDPAALFFLLAGLGFLTFAGAAAVYSSRELAMDGLWLRALSLVNHLGALLFTASLVALLWHYPRRLGRFPAVAAAYLTALGWWLADLMQWVDDPATGNALPTLLLFAVTFLCAGGQWWHTRRRPLERAALKWFLLSIYLGTGLFAAVILLPNALGAAPVASQGVMFVAFLAMFAGIALGIVRYRLFDLDRWWLGAWRWFLGGVAVVLLDLALVSLAGMAGETALAVAVAVVGWGWFPLRQWLWGRLLRHGPAAGQERLLGWVQALFAPADARSLRERWGALLHRELQPLERRTLAERAEGVAIHGDGEALLVPDPAGEGALLLAHAGHGARLFGAADRATAELLLRLGRHAHEALAARERGAAEERRRIMRDLHDDLGAKLLSLIYLTGDGEGQAVARGALQDLRDILAALEAEAAPLGEALAEWEAEARARADEQGVALEWCSDGVTEAVVATARERGNIGRILREGLTNALRHGAPRRLRVAFALAGGRLRFAIEDDGSGTPPEESRFGRGSRIARNRAADLGGGVEWGRSEGLGGVAMRVEVGLGRVEAAGG